MPRIPLRNALPFVFALAAARLHAGDAAAAKPFVHPGAPLTREDLDYVKARLDREPWRTGFRLMRDDYRSRVEYGVRGPWEVVARFPGRNERLGEWRHDMRAVFNLARMWYFTDEDAYARKARDILIAWADTQKRFDGWESMLDLGDYVHCFVAGADILRGAWPGWTDEDTAKVKRLFMDVYWPATGLEGKWIGPANKGALAIAAGTAIAVFCDDREKFDFCLELFRVTASCALPNTLSTGQLGETGRDMGHAYGQMVSLVHAAEIFWKQGVDVYAELDNRLLAVGEYYARFNMGGEKPPFIPMGATDALYWHPAAHPWPHGRRGFNMLVTAYRTRKGLPTPWLDRKRPCSPIDADAYCFYREEDASVAAPPPPYPFAPALPVTRGLDARDLGNAEPAGSARYEDGVWTVIGGGEEIWRHGNDSAHFASMPAKGNFTLTAKVDGVEGPRPNGKAALMFRENLDPHGQKAWVAITPEGHAEWFMSGWTMIRGNWEKGARHLPDFKLPYWLKLERVGDMVNLYVAADGTSWSCIGQGRFGNLGPDTHIGLAVCSLENGTPATARFRHVRMTGGDGGEAPSVPEAPLAVLAAPGDACVPLRWAESFGAAEYRVKRADSADGPYRVIATVGTASHIDRDVTPGRTYRYTVSAVNEAGESPDAVLPPNGDAAAPDDPWRSVADDAVVTSSVSNGGPNGTWWAFDQSYDTWWHSGAPAREAWLQVELRDRAAPPAVRFYELAVPWNNPECDPTAWTVEGSADGVAWTVLDRRAGHAFTERVRPARFALRTPGRYPYYRLTLTASQGGPDRELQLAEWRLLAPAAPARAR